MYCSFYTCIISLRNNKHCPRSLHVYGKVVLLCCYGGTLLWGAIHNRAFDDCINTEVCYYCALEKAQDLGKVKIKEILFWLNLLHPLFTITLQFLNTKDYLWAWDKYKEIDLCLGDPRNNWGSYNNNSQTKAHDLCLNLSATEHDSYFLYIITIFRLGICWIQLLFLYLASRHFWDLMLYCSIFGSMRK